MPSLEEKEEKRGGEDKGEKGEEKGERGGEGKGREGTKREERMSPIQ